MWGEFFAEHALAVPILGALLLASAFFSGTETALFSLTPGQLYKLRQSRHRLSRLVGELMRTPRKTLNVLLLGNMIVNVAYAADSAVLLEDLRHRAGHLSLLVATLIVLLGLILVGEVTPKMVAIRLGARWAVPVSAPLTVIAKVLHPIVWILDRTLVSPATRILAPRPSESGHVSAEDLGALMEVSARRGLLPAGTSAFIQEVIELTDLAVDDVMVPRVDMVTFDLAQGRDALLDLFRRTHLKRVPVYEGDVDHITGIIHFKRVLLNPRTPLSELVRPVVFVPDAANLEQALLTLRVRGTQLAIVVDEYGGTAGLITMEDILSEIVGEIPDPDAAPEGPLVERISERVFVVDADLGIHEWADAFRMELSDQRVSTIGGFLTARLGRLAAVGDTIRWGNLRFEVVSLRRRRIGKVRVELLHGAAGETDGNGSIAPASPEPPHGETEPTPADMPEASRVSEPVEEPEAPSPSAGGASPGRASEDAGDRGGREGRP